MLLGASTEASIAVDVRCHTITLHRWSPVVTGFGKSIPINCLSSSTKDTMAVAKMKKKNMLKDVEDDTDETMKQELK